MIRVTADIIKHAQDSDTVTKTFKSVTLSTAVQSNKMRKLGEIVLVPEITIALVLIGFKIAFPEYYSVTNTSMIKLRNDIFDTMLPGVRTSANNVYPSA